MTDATPDHPPPMQTETALEQASAVRGRAQGGYARAAALSGARRSEIARTAARARWARARGLRQGTRP
jgi:hypothetical protein